MAAHPLTEPAFDSRHFRSVLGEFCTGVTVITAMDGAEPVGFACQSFQSLSLSPPLVSFAPAVTSTSYPRIRSAGRFAANVLADDQEDVCRVFAVSGGPKFDGIAWATSPAGSPVVDGALAWIDCEIEREIEAGDHVIVIGRVLDLGAPASGRPLLFFRGQYASLSRPRPSA